MLLFESRCNIRKKQPLDGKTFIDTLFLLLLFFIMGTRGRSHLFHVSIDYKVPRNPSNIAFFLTRCLWKGILHLHQRVVILIPLRVFLKLP